MLGPLLGSAGSGCLLLGECPPRRYIATGPGYRDILAAAGERRGVAPGLGMRGGGSAGRAASSIPRAAPTFMSQGFSVR